MTPNELVEALRKADPTDEGVIDRLSRDIEEQARAPVRAAVALANDPDPDMFGKAALLLSDIGDLAIVPLLESGQPREVPVRLWSMETVLSAHLAVRDRIVARLDAMLADRTELDWGTVGPEEEIGPPSRVCDEAYLLMRRLLNVHEGRMESVRERDAFLALSEEAKDAELIKARRSGTWSNLLGREE